MDTSIANANVTFVFECILRNNSFMDYIDEYINKTLLTSNKFDTKHVPQMVLLIMTLLDTNNNYVDVKNTIKDDGELQDLLELFYAYIIKKIMLDTKNETELNQREFKHSFDICCRLAIFKLKLNFKNKKKTLGCMGK